MTKDMLPERLRNIPGLEMVDPSKKEKRVVMLSEAQMEVLERDYIDRLKQTESA